METDRGDSRVAVVMITHNRVREVLRSLEELTKLPERPRIVLVDNGSNDGTARAVAERFPGVEIFDAGGNLGAAARTVGVQHVEGPYIAFCDDDTWWNPGCLRRAADLFDAHPRLAIITGRVLVGPENREDPVCDLLASSPLPREPGMPGPPLLGFLAGASVVRRSAFLEVGGFEPRFFIGGEEELLAADLAARQWWLCYVPDLVVHHHPSRLRNSIDRRSTMARNALWFAWLRRPLPVALRKTLQLASHRPWSRDTWRALAEALRGLPWVLSRRRVLPPEVERGLCLLEARS
jgi:GT2 family glycosyltransferase